MSSISGSPSQSFSGEYTQNKDAKNGKATGFFQLTAVSGQENSKSTKQVNGGNGVEYSELVRTTIVEKEGLNSNTDSDQESASLSTVQTRAIVRILPSYRKQRSEGSSFKGSYNAPSIAFLLTLLIAAVAILSSKFAHKFSHNTLDNVRVSRRAQSDNPEVSFTGNATDSNLPAQLCQSGIQSTFIGQTTELLQARNYCKNVLEISIKGADQKNDIGFSLNILSVYNLLNLPNGLIESDVNTAKADSDLSLSKIQSSTSKAAFNSDSNGQNVQSALTAWQAVEIVSESLAPSPVPTQAPGNDSQPTPTPAPTNSNVTEDAVSLAGDQPLAEDNPIAASGLAVAAGGALVRIVELGGGL